MPQPSASPFIKKNHRQSHIQPPPKNYHHAAATACSTPISAPNLLQKSHHHRPPYLPGSLPPGAQQKLYTQSRIPQQLTPSLIRSAPTPQSGSHKRGTRIPSSELRTPFPPTILHIKLRGFLTVSHSQGIYPRPNCATESPPFPHRAFQSSKCIICIIRQ
jgi:hypothetical protein